MCKINNICKMSTKIAILSKIPNLGKEINLRAPNLLLKEITKEADYYDLTQSEIIVADFDLLVPHISSLKQTKWIQGTWAGVDKLIPHFNSKIFSSAIVTRFSGKHFGRLMSEYVVAHIINNERQFFDFYENQKQKTWNQNGQITPYRSIGELTIGILGVGNIGNYIARTLNSFGAKIWGFGRRNSLPKSEEYKQYEEYCTVKTLPNLLTACDYVVNVLPNTTETKGLLNGTILKNCAGKKTVFINIGRGSIINENDLVQALKNKWLSAAILDVFETEPLPQSSPLWNINQVFITPHIAAVTRAKDFAESFIENLELYQTGKQIPTQLQPGNEY